MTYPKTFEWICRWGLAASSVFCLYFWFDVKQTKQLRMHVVGPTKQPVMLLIKYNANQINSQIPHKIILQFIRQPCDWFHFSSKHRQKTKVF